MFRLESKFKPKGDQPAAIKKLVAGYEKYPRQTLLGVTGSGKTFTIANLITKVQKPTLILSHNKTLAAQLYNEFRDFFPHNKVCYFVSYYDYYQPESYLPVSDTYIEKDSQINEKIEQLRLEAAASLLSRDDVIVVSSVSCIYGLGKPNNFKKGAINIEVGQRVVPDQLVARLVDIHYENMDIELKAGGFRLRGDVIEIIPGSGTTVIRVELDDDKIRKISELHPITFVKNSDLRDAWIFPAKNFVFDDETTKVAIKNVRQELKERLPQLDQIQAYRLEKRTNYDMELLEQTGFCKGIENYSRHFDGRKPGEQPYTLMDYFKSKGEFMVVVDESHVALPQVHGMHGGDEARKKNLIDHGFRLPSAYDNRPLTFKELEKYLKTETNYCHPLLLAFEKAERFRKKYLI